MLVMLMSVVCYPYLKKSADKGRIINITSMSAHLGFSEVVPYCTSKGAVLAMTRALAVEWAGDNITVNSIAPGWFRSKMNEQVVDAARKQNTPTVYFLEQVDGEHRHQNGETVDTEDKEKPYTDDELAETLKTKGYIF